MTPQDLLAAFDVLADAPDGVKRLRALVLSLAVRGKLVAQDPTEGAVGDLLAAIDGERAERVAAGEFRPSAGSKLDPPPFAVPASWRWVPLGRLVFLEMGQSPPSSDYNQVGLGLPFFQGKADFGAHTPTPRYWCTAPTKFARRGDVLLSVRAPVGPTNFADVDCCIGRGLAALRPLAGVPAAFILWVMRALEANLTLRASGTTFVAVSKQDLEPFPVPVPPLAEQHRIVARVDELMALLDRLEAARTTRDAVRRAARDAALADLRDAPDAEVVEAAWGRIARQMDELFSEPEDVKPLREAIMALAVRGRLVARDPGEPSVDELLQRLGSLNDAQPRRDAVPPVSRAEHPFTPPDGWTFARLDVLCDLRSGVTKGRNLQGRATITLPYLRVANVKAGYLDVSAMKMIEVPLDEVADYQVQPGDVLLTEGGDWDKLGRSAVWAGEIANCIHQNHVFVARPRDAGVASEWISLFTNSPDGREYFQSCAKQTTNLASINKTQLRHTVVPLPPPLEQARILRRLASLLGICDKLDGQLRTAVELQGQFAVAAVFRFES